MQLENEKGLRLVDNTARLYVWLYWFSTSKPGIRLGTVLQALGHTADKWSFGFSVLFFHFFTDVILSSTFFLISYGLFKKYYKIVG